MAEPMKSPAPTTAAVALRAMFATFSLVLRLISLAIRSCQCQNLPMRWQDLAEEDCSLSRTLAVIGDRWTLLILRDAFLRVRRFEEFEKSLKIARRVLSERLTLLVDQEILARLPYQVRPT